MGDIAWLASYPKSGNTWLRVFLANLLNKGEGPADINRLTVRQVAAGRRDFDEILGVESSDMTRAEIERRRPLFYRGLAARSDGTLYVKVHDAFVSTPCGKALIPAEVTARAVYLVRNPLDVAVSLAHHTRRTTDFTIDAMADPGFAFCAQKDRLHEQLEQRLLSWSGHVVSWLDQDSVAVHMMRYEDMVRQPVSTFAGCAEFLGIKANAEDIDRALAFSSFSALRAQEQASGFSEKPSGAKYFFRSGKAGDWRDKLTGQQVELILKDHSAVMRRLGYIDEADSIL